MEMKWWRDLDTNETCLLVKFTDEDLVKAPLDRLERWAMESPKEYPIADTLMDAQRIAFRLEQSALRGKP